LLHTIRDQPSYNHQVAGDKLHNDEGGLDIERRVDQPTGAYMAV